MTGGFTIQPLATFSSTIYCQGELMMQRLQLRRSLLSYVGLFFAVITLMVGCGRSAVQTATPPATPTSSAITVGFSAWPGWMPWQVATEANLLNPQGSRAQLKWFDNYLDSLKALQSGQIQANSQTLNDTIASVASGSDQVIVLVNDNSTGNDKIIARPGITSTADLKGKKIAVETGTVDHFLLLLGMNQAGLSPNDVTLVSLETSKAAAAFAAGEVDAAAVFAPFTTEALKRPGSKELFSSKDFPGAVADHLVVTRSLIKDHPDQVQALVNTWFDTLAYVEKNANQANAIMAKRMGVNVAGYQQYATGTKIFSLAENLKALYPALGANDSIATTALSISKFMTENGLSKSLPNIDRLVDDQFVKAYAAKQKA
jgi:NitT/TauT family transport system substrate-binding protein